MAINKQPKGGDADQGAGRPKSRWQDYGESILIALVLALFIRAFLVQAFSIPSGSMEPTLLVGDYLLVNKLAYGIRNPLTNSVWIPLGKPKRGDVAVFIYPQSLDKDYIKRIIGLPGDRIQIINKKLYLNGEPAHIPPLSDDPEAPRAVYREPEITPTERDNYGPVVVPEDCYFVMGDNRDRSYDSRFWGFVPMQALKGRAFIIYFSWAGDGQPQETLIPSLLKAFRDLTVNLSWNSKVFRVRWQRLGKLIY
ncbi:MAG: signal peptidase I [Desulfobaccales bacterium]